MAPDKESTRNVPLKFPMGFCLLNSASCQEVNSPRAAARLMVFAGRSSGQQCLLSITYGPVQVRMLGTP